MQTSVRTTERRGGGPHEAAPAPQLADGIELIGRFEDSGLKEPPFIARRADGQIVQMAPMLYALAEEIDGSRGYAEIAERLSHRIERGVTGEMAEMLIEEQLRPLGIVAGRDGSDPQLRKLDPLLALKFRTKVVPARVTSALTTVFKPLFHGPVVAAAVLGFVALLVWLLGVHGISQGLRHVIYQPALVLMLLGGVVLATAFHEIGHASGLRYGGGKPGVMGVGVYIVWPAFYTDITDSYRLDKKGRLRTDLGGMYFNAIFALAVGGLYAVTRYEPLLLLIVIQTFAIIQQSLPLLRLDGYYIVSDLTGVPDILARIRPILRSVLPWREADESVTALKPWVRKVVTGYVLVLVPVIAFIFLMLLVNAPRVLATGWDSFWLHWDRVGPRFSAGETARGALSVFQMLVLVLPATGLLYTTGRVGARAGSLGWRWSDGSPTRRAGLLAGTAAAAGLAAFLLWPHGAYRPIQPYEKGTLVGAVRQLNDVPSGRASLTPERERDLGGAPTERQLQREGRQRPLDTSDGLFPPPSGDGRVPADSPTEAQPSPGAQPQQPAEQQPAPSESQPAPAEQPAPEPTGTTPAEPAPTETAPTTTSTTPATP
ncbi:MAG: putative peptide zinc metalloprotease protein [Thermoleophilaceae bacterium]|nr:putative peptide zinc metalloprotease protein [Thermoleophilaceae bacterium]